MEQGINEDEKEVIDRKNAFGSNTYPKKKGKNFFVSKESFTTSSTVFLSVCGYSYVFFQLSVCPKDVPLGSLARFNSHHLDHSGCNIIGIGNKDRGIHAFLSISS